MESLVMPPNKIPLLNREISWLHFNGRVLQEAADDSVPLMERIKFLAIYSSNLDEFYRVRVATLVRLTKVNSQAKALLGYNAKKILQAIQKIVLKQEKIFNKLYSETLTDALEKQSIFIVNEKQLDSSQGVFVREYFKANILSNIVPIIGSSKNTFPDLKDRTLYFFVRFLHNSEKKKHTYALIELPTTLPRFLVLPEHKEGKSVILIDDVIKYCLDDIFYVLQYENIDCYSIQLTRDAELDLDKHVGDKFIEKLSKSLDKRKEGEPMRLLYDSEMPQGMLQRLIKELNIHNESLIAGGRYHRFSDFYKFPNIAGPQHTYQSLEALKNSGLKRDKSMFSRIRKKDFIVHFPYQSFDYFLLFLREAAIDPKVLTIEITLYRLAENSRVVNALINAARNGKKVFCVLEVTARFDEEANIYWKSKLEEAGVRVNYGLTDYKVHSKICLVSRMLNGKVEYFANLATGNYNEATATLYCDHSIFTHDKAITKDLRKLFSALHKGKVASNFPTLIVSPIDARKRYTELIKQEIKWAKAGYQAYMIIKVNSLADEGMIKELYAASRAGVKIQLIVRGICCLIPGVKGFSENITVISIIDKFLEHARVFIFGNRGDELMYLSSADLMARNLDHRVEVGFPIKDPEVKEEIKTIIDYQLKDNVKARLITRNATNAYKKEPKMVKVRSQIEAYNYLKQKHQ